MIKLLMIVCLTVVMLLKSFEAYPSGENAPVKLIEAKEEANIGAGGEKSAIEQDDESLTQSGNSDETLNGSESAWGGWGGYGGYGGWGRGIGYGWGSGWGRGYGGWGGWGRWRRPYYYSYWG